MKNKIIILLSVVAILFMACNEWEQMVALPLSEKPTSGRVVLIEEFTGAKCPNCPAGTKALEAIADKYPDNVVVVGVHSNFLANPAVTGDPKLSYPEAQEVENYLGAWLGKPEAAFNRKKFTNQSNIRIGKPDTWIVYVEEELKLIPAANLLISRKYSDANRELTIELKTIAKQNIDKAIHLHVMITESNIFTTQESSTGNIPNYNQKHVLRKVITPIPGDKIADNLVSGQEVIKEYKYTLPSDAVLWKSENCSVVAFLSYDESNKTILQAAEIKVK
jgi:thiol-disulfide isomerase/thioredoxin